MDVALVTEFSASRKDPLAAVLERIHGAFLASGLGEPTIQFTFADAPVPGFASSVDRVIRRHPEFERFVSSAAAMPGGPALRMLSNGVTSPAASEAVPFWTLLKIAAGVPRSFPFHTVAVHFQSRAFGTAAVSHPLFSRPPGIVVTDSWWVNGRMRGITGVTCVSADAAAATLPSPPAAVATVFAACGKAKKTVQVPLSAAAPASHPTPAAAPPETLRAIGEIVVDYKARMAEIVERARLPHDLPPAREAMRAVGAGDPTGPKKPVLVRAFQPLGYDCASDSGTYTLRRRTAGNLTVEIYLDVGTWSRSVSAFFRVNGFGFGARLALPVSRQAIGAGQYSIGNAENWQKIVDNLAALVAELDRTYVPAIEAAAGPTPDWYRPE